MSKLALLAGAALGIALAACGSSIDPRVGRHYLCSEPGLRSSCPAEWICGLDGYCRDPQVSEPAACRDDLQCATGWRCGAQLGAAPGKCQQIGLASPYPCASDAHCEAGWRCGVEKACVDPAPDALPPVPALGWSGGLFSPRSFTGEPLMVRYEQPPPGNIRPHGIATLGADGITYLRVEVGFDSPNFMAKLALDGATVRDMAVGPDAVYVAEARGFYRFTPSTRTYEQLSATRVTRVYASAAPFPIAVGFTGNTLLLAAEPAVPYLMPSPINDVAVLSFPSGAAGPEGVLLVATGDGFRAAAMLARGYRQADGTSGTRPNFGLYGVTNVANSFCAPPQPQEFEVLAIGSTWQRTGGTIAVAVRPWNSPSAPVRVGLLYMSGTRQACTPSGVYHVDAPDTLMTTTCLPCAPGETLAGQATELGARGHLVTTACRSTATGTYRFQALNPQSSPACADEMPIPSVRFGPGHPIELFDPTLTFFAARDGRLSVAQGGIEPLMMTPGQRPPFLAGAPGRRTTTTLLGSSMPASFAELAGFGLARTSSGLAPTAVVEGQPDWAMDSSRLVSFQLGKVIANTNTDGVSLAATLACSREGRRFLLSGHRDILVAGDVEAQLAGSSSIGLLESQLNPVPGAAIRSIAPVTPSGATPPFLQAYVLTRNEVARVTATTSQRWRSELLPLPDGDWLKVWGDGPRARIGYADGSVYGLAAFVKLASGLPDGSTVQDYAQVCGRGIAVTTTGLFELVAEGTTGTGSWRRLTQPPAGTPTTGARLRGGGDLHLMLQNGQVWHFVPSGCAPEAASGAACSVLR